MATPLDHPKSNLVREYTPRVLYVIVLYVLILFFQDHYIRFIAGQFATVSYKDNLEERRWLVDVFTFLCCLVFCYVNKKTFDIIKKESTVLWAIHAGIDLLLYAICMLVVIFSNNFLEKTYVTMRDVHSPLAMLFVFGCKHFIMRMWYQYEMRKRKVGKP